MRLRPSAWAARNLAVAALRQEHPDQGQPDSVGAPDDQRASQLAREPEQQFLDRVAVEREPHAVTFPPARCHNVFTMSARSNDMDVRRTYSRASRILSGSTRRAPSGVDSPASMKVFVIRGSTTL